MKKIIVLALLSISLVSCMDNNMGDKKEQNNEIQNIEITDEEVDMINDILEINE